MIEFRFPSLGADMDDGMLVGWLVAPGDVVHRGDVVAEVETDKGLVEVETWDEGRVAELLVQPGPDRIGVGTPLAHFEPLEEKAPAAEDHAAPADVVAPPAPVPVAEPVEAAPERVESPAAGARVTPPVRHLAHQLGVDVDALARTGGPVTREEVMAAAHPTHGTPPSPHAPPARPAVRASPLARQVAEELGVDLATVTSTRADELVTSDDVRTAAKVPRSEPPLPEETAVPPPETPAQDRVEAMRRAIARSMSHSKREIPHYYLGTRIDMAAATTWLDAENERRPLERRLLPAALLLRATALAVSAVPEINGHWVDGAFRPSGAVHLGVAVSLREGGLVAPAIHDADQLDVDATMEALRDVVNRARTWRIRSSEMSDPTITVTNLGDRGVETAFPVIIPPQVAIVGFGRIVEQPVAVDGMLTVHPVVHATLAGDHRVTDGHRGGLFLAELDRLLQEPDRL